MRGGKGEQGEARGNEGRQGGMRGGKGEQGEARGNEGRQGGKEGTRGEMRGETFPMKYAHNRYFLTYHTHITYIVLSALLLLITITCMSYHHINCLMSLKTT